MLVRMANVDMNIEHDVQLAKDAERLNERFEEQIVRLNVKGLLQLVATLEIRKGRYTDKGKFEIIREIRSAVDKVLKDDLVTGILSLGTVCDRIGLLLRDTKFCDDNTHAESELETKYKNDSEIVSPSNSDVSWKPENDIGGDVNDTCSAVERSREENLSDVSDSDFSDEIDTPRGSEYGEIAKTGQVKKELHKFNQSSDIDETEILKRRLKIDMLRDEMNTLKMEVKCLSAHKEKSKHRNKLAFESSNESGCDSSTVSESCASESEKERSVRSRKKSTRREKCNDLPRPRRINRNQTDKARGDKVSIRDLRDAWRKELRFKGQIGKGGGRENKLDFISVKRQIDAARKKEYSDSDIIEAVINATTAGSDLRALLQSMGYLTVEGLLDILRSYYEELDEGDLLQKLATAKQGNDEDPKTFVIRVLAIKNHIVTESENSSTNFSEELLRKIMNKSLESGIWNESIRNWMRPVLSRNDVSDAMILREIGLAIQSEKIRKEKFGAKKQVRFCMMKQDEEEGNARGNRQDERDKDKETTEKSKIYMMIEELKGEVYKLREHIDAEVDSRMDKGKTGKSDVLEIMKEVKSEVNELKQQMGGRSQWRPRYGCQKCKRDGTASLCNHCFKCGSESHKIAECPNRNTTASSNMQRPLTDRGSQ